MSFVLIPVVVADKVARPLLRNATYSSSSDAALFLLFAFSGGIYLVVAQGGKILKKLILRRFV